MTTATDQDSDRFGRLLFRALMLRVLARAAMKTLIARQMTMRDGSVQRWPKPKISAYIRDLPRVADQVRKSAALDDLPTRGSRLMVELSVLTIAAYRLMLTRDVQPADARRAVADVGWRVYALGLRLTSLPFRLSSRDPGKRLRRTLRVMLRFPFNGAGAPGYEVVAEEKGDDFLTHFTHCPPQSFVRRLVAEQGDQGDLEAFIESWCQYDWPGADVIAADGKPGHYLRRKTLSNGDNVCDMCWKASSGN